MHWFVRHLIYLSLTKPQCSNVFIQVRNICLSTSLLVLLDILLVLKVKLGTFLPINRCPFWFNLKYIFVSLCMYSGTLRMQLLAWCKVVSQAGLFGSGLARPSVCQNISGWFRACIQNFFIALGVRIFFFREVNLLCSSR